MAFNLQRTASLQRQVRFRCSNCCADRRIAHPCSAPPRDLDVASMRIRSYREATSSARDGSSRQVFPSGAQRRGDQVQAILAGEAGD